jgi:hypothetical protein
VPCVLLSWLVETCGLRPSAFGLLLVRGRCAWRLCSVWAVVDSFLAGNSGRPLTVNFLFGRATLRIPKKGNNNIAISM